MMIVEAANSRHYILLGGDVKGGMERRVDRAEGMVNELVSE